MALSCVASSCKSNKFKTGSNVNLISVSTPYMLHLHPVTIPSTISDPMGLESTKYEDVDSADRSMNDGMEHIFNSTTQLRYGRDLRLNEVSGAVYLTKNWCRFPFNFFNALVLPLES